MSTSRKQVHWHAVGLLLDQCGATCSQVLRCLRIRHALVRLQGLVCASGEFVCVRYSFISIIESFLHTFLFGSLECAHDQRWADNGLSTAGPTPTGAEGTFNYLVDLIMDVPATREMFMRRLRTLMDTFLQGRLEQVSA